MESGAYANELREIGFYTGSSLRLLLWAVVHLLPLVLLSLIKVSRRKRYFNFSKLKKIIHISLLLLCFYSIPIFIYGPTFISGVNRYDFLEKRYVDIFNIKLLIATYCFYLGAIRNWENLRNQSRNIFLGVLFIMVCYGEKFSGPVNAMIFYATGHYFAMGDEKIRPFKIFRMYGMIAISLVFIYGIALFSIGRNLDIIIAAALNRIAREGAMWWAVDVAYANNNKVITKSLADIINYFQYKAVDPGEPTFQINIYASN